MDTSLPTYVLLLLIRLLLSSSSSIDLRPCTEGEEEGRPEWTLGRARVTTPCAALNGERGKIEKSFPHPIPRLVTLMGNMEGRPGGGGTIVLLAGRDEMRGLARGRGALLSRGNARHPCGESFATVNQKEGRQSRSVIHSPFITSMRNIRMKKYIKIRTKCYF